MGTFLIGSVTVMVIAVLLTGTASEPTTAEPTTPEETSPEDATLEETSAETTTAEETSSEAIIAEKTTPEETFPEVTTTKQATSESATHERKAAVELLPATVRILRMILRIRWITPPTDTKSKSCPPNEVHRECDFLCQPSCNRPKRTTKNCPYICFPRCLCKKPLVRRESDGKCVLPSMCPKLPINKYGPLIDHIPFYKNIPDHTRPPTDQYGTPRDTERPPLGQYGPPRDAKKPKTDQHGTQTEHRIQPMPHSFGLCPPQERLSARGGACQPTCRHSTRFCEKGCICKAPFVRNEADGQCVRRLDCPDKTIECWRAF